MLHLVLFTAVQQYFAAVLGKADSNVKAARKQLHKQMRAPPSEVVAVSTTSMDAKKNKGKTTPFGVNFLRGQALYRAVA